MHNKLYLGVFFILIAFVFSYVLKNELPITEQPQAQHRATEDGQINPEAQPKPHATDAYVTRVIDGDTLLAITDDMEVRVRLLGVDAAELEFDDEERTTKRECYAKEAKLELARLSEGKEVQLVHDELNNDTDDYGRLLRYVYLPDGTLVNQILIENGFTRHLSYFPITQNDAFAESEKAARESNLGLWGVCN